VAKKALAKAGQGRENYRARRENHYLHASDAPLRESVARVGVLRWSHHAQCFIIRERSFAGSAQRSRRESAEKTIARAVHAGACRAAGSSRNERETRARVNETEKAGSARVRRR
jgi:hypothetical protein